jgi:lipid-A-disaccharide synthase
MKLCIITGEASGDLHAASVVASLRRQRADLEIFGMGGAALRSAGVEILHDVKEMAIVGLFNVFAHLPHLVSVLRDLKREIAQRRPDAVVLVDFPDFNLRLAAHCRRLGIPVIYFISPQVWAWRKGRIRKIARLVDRMLVVFPFEEELYRREGVDVTYVGHPLVDQLSSVRPAQKNLESGRLRLALLPGSRRHEISTLLRPMLEAARELGRRRPLEAFIIKAPTVDRQLLTAELEADGEFEIIEQGGTAALASAHLALCSSGTATLEAAILRTPSVVVYRLSRLTHLVARWLVDLPHFSLVNIVAGRSVLPELLQDQVTSATIVEEAEGLLDPDRYRALQHDLDDVYTKLGAPGASDRTARAILDLMESGAAAAAD